MGFHLHLLTKPLSTKNAKTVKRLCNSGAWLDWLHSACWNRVRHWDPHRRGKHVASVHVLFSDNRMVTPTNCHVKATWSKLHWASVLLEVPQDLTVFRVVVRILQSPSFPPLLWGCKTHVKNSIQQYLAVPFQNPHGCKQPNPYKNTFANTVLKQLWLVCYCPGFKVLMKKWLVMPQWCDNTQCCAISTDVISWCRDRTSGKWLKPFIADAHTGPVASYWNQVRESNTQAAWHTDGARLKVNHHQMIPNGYITLLCVLSMTTTVFVAFGASAFYTLKPLQTPIFSANTSCQRPMLGLEPESMCHGNGKSLF